jgi:hypothetical protein
MFVCATVALSGVYASLVSIKGLTETTIYTDDLNGGRYLLPVLLAWFTTTMTMLFADRSSVAPTLAPSHNITDPPASTIALGSSFPALKHNYWLAIGALLIMALGVFVLPKNKPPLPENPSPDAAATSILNNPETNNTSENHDLQTRLYLAQRLEMAGKFAEAVQVGREAVRLYPNDPVALKNLAWNLAASPRRDLRNGREAVQLASKAVELTDQQQAVFIETLAAAYAEDGQFAKAVETAKQARDVALLDRQVEVAMKSEQLLKLYSSGKTIGSMNGP